MTAKKTVLQLNIHEERIRKKVLVAVSRSPGVTSIAMDDKTGKMTIIGDVDVPVIVMKLRKICNAEIDTVEVVKPPEKKPEPKKPDASKPPEVAFPVQMINPYQYQYHSFYPNYCYQPGPVYKVEEEPVFCVIM